MHRPTFLAEYEAFVILRDAGKQSEIDPLWMSALMMVCCLAVRHLSDNVDSPLVKIRMEEMPDRSKAFFDAALSSLEGGDWTSRPRIRTLQVQFSCFVHVSTAM
jgi:hypothetical protein